MDFDGYAIGGVSVGEPEPEMMKAVELSEPHLPAGKARYAMGPGTPPRWWNSWRGAWTCLTACCPPGWPERNRIHEQGHLCCEGWR